MMVDISAGQVVKICGLMDAGAAHTARNAGADMLGFILAESRRQVTPAMVASVRTSLTRGGHLPAIVGVMVNPTPRQVAAQAGEAQLDYVQLSGDESPDLLDELEVPVIRTVHVAAGMTMDELAPRVDPWFQHRRPAAAILIDARIAGIYGGSGTQSDWTVAAQLSQRYPSMLAGGLKPGNVYEGVQAVGPHGVDVSSGVEVAGAKDATLIEAFVARARQGFGAMQAGLATG